MEQRRKDGGRGAGGGAAAAPERPGGGLPPLNWLRGFEAAARCGSFTAAAAALGLTQAAVSYQVRCLERHLGLALFEREAHGVRLTELGRAYLPTVQRAFDEIASATIGLFGARGDTPLVIRTHPSFAALRLAPILPAFRAAYPGIPLRIYSAIWGTAVPAEEVDVEIRFGRGDWPGFGAERLEDGPLVAVGAPGRGPVAPEALRGETLIEIMEVDDAWTRMFADAGLPPPRPGQILRVDSTLVALELAAAGLGSAIVFRSMARSHLAAGRVSDLGLPDRPARMAHYLLRPLGAARERPAARLFRRWLPEALARDAEGAAPG